MAELANFPMVSQRTGITSDGLPSENADFDCVPASIGAGLLWFMGKHQWDSTMNPDVLKDHAYGEAWHNAGTAAKAFIPICATLGYRLYPLSGDGVSLVKQAHSHIKAGHPVIFTEPDPYAAASLGFSHVCVFYKEISGGLASMDPFIARAVQGSDSDWANRLLFSQIWILEKDGGSDVIDLQNPWAAGYFKQTATSPHRWHCAKTQQDLQAGILLGWTQMNGAPRLPIGPETKCGKTAVYQECEAGILLYDPDHEIDAPSGPWAPCYLLKLDTDLAKKVLSIG